MTKKDGKPMSVRLDADLRERMQALTLTLSPPLELTLSQVMRAVWTRGLAAIEADASTVDDNVDKDDAFKRGAEDMRKQIATYLWRVYEIAKHDPGLWGEHPARFREIAEGLDLQAVP